MNPVVTDDAARDLDEIYEYISQESVDAADRTFDRLYTAFHRLANGELQGRMVRLRDGRRAQRWPVSPYLVYYRRTVEQTLILRVYHGARQPIER